MHMTKLTPESRKKLRSRSRLVHFGRDSDANHGFINFPAYRGSTVLFPDVATMKSRNQRYTYGTHGTPTTDALCEGWSELAGAAGTVLVPSGLFAIIAALTTALSSGDHLLVTDSAYQPARVYCDTVLKRMGVETTYYDPAVGAGIAPLMRPNTRAIFVEAPGSQSLEMQDVPAIAAAAKERENNVCIVMDNTWATPLLFSPHEHGVDLAVEAGTKYLSGHSDLLLGLVSANDAWFRRLQRTVDTLAVQPGPEDVYLALRGLRTMELRLREAERQALGLAHWLKSRPEVKSVIHPALPDYSGHEIWKRYFKGIVGTVFRSPESRLRSRRRRDAGRPRIIWHGLFVGRVRKPRHPLRLFKISHGDALGARGPTLRFSVGLEDIEDLKEDLDRGFARLAKRRQCALSMARKRAADERELAPALKRPEFCGESP